MGIAPDVRSSTPFGGAGGTTYVWKMLAKNQGLHEHVIFFVVRSHNLLRRGHQHTFKANEQHERSDVVKKLESYLSHEKDPLTFHYTGCLI